MNVNDIKLILFDLDGVVLSERTYWKCASSCVLKKLGFDECEDAEGLVLCNDRTLTLLKNMRCNSNWDLTDMIYQAAVTLGFEKNDLSLFERIYEFFYSMRDKNMYEVYDYFASCGGYTRDDERWQKTTELFNEMYYSEYINYQSSVVDLSRLKGTLAKLKENYTLGIGTGRPLKDCDAGLDILEIREYFEEDRIITYDDVTDAEKRHNKTSLGKPSPYMFLRGMSGRNADDTPIIENPFHIMAKNTLVIGDAASDMTAAKAAGAYFCAVLTGAAGQSARKFFEENGADVILDDVTYLPQFMRG
jgi:phosphoglycolate phosphatase-like HAD superfamily hydrolase